MRSLTASLLVTGLRAQPASPPSFPSGGTGTCPCTGWDSTEYESDGAIQLTLGATTYAYPTTYGKSCSAHDQSLQPYCDASIAEPPDWCSQQWCYVNQDNCDHLASKSSYFPDKNLVYSYRSCGADNTFDSWFGDNAAADGSHTLTDIIDTVEGYLKSITNSLETNHYELQSATRSCEYDTSCDCNSCKDGPGEWCPKPGTDDCQQIDVQTTTISVRKSVREGEALNSAAQKTDECLSGIVGTAFTRVAAIEANTSALGYEYYASQEMGNYVQWPGLQWCPDTYDPRRRPWYANSASGPKDVVVVIDTSGSMSGSRIRLAREAAKFVIGTLTESDYAGVVTFATRSFSYASQMVKGSAANIAEMETWIDNNVDASGSTEFVDAFAKVWEIFSASDGASPPRRSGCNRVVLFLTDGVPNSWSSGDYQSVADQAAAQGDGFHLMTYALGDGADTSILKRLACENRGITYAISDADADNGALESTMASYYTLLSPMLRPCRPRWVNYTDWFSGTKLLAACLPAYALLEQGAATSCDGGLDGLGESGDSRVPELLGVACVDINLLARADYPQFEARVKSEQEACPRTVVTEQQLDTLRARVSDAAVCGAAAPPANSDKVEVTIKVASSMANFDASAEAAIQQHFATMLGVNTADVTVTVDTSAGQVTIKADVPDASQAQTTLETELATPADAGTELTTALASTSVGTVEVTESPVIGVSTTSDIGGIVGGIVGGVVGIIVLAIVFKWICSSRSKAKSTANKNLEVARQNQPPPAANPSSNPTPQASVPVVQGAYPVGGPGTGQPAYPAYGNAYPAASATPYAAGGAYPADGGGAVPMGQPVM